MSQFNPTLAFVFLKASHNKYDTPTEFKALHDSGCAATTMNTKAYMRLANANNVALTQPAKPIIVQSCTGELTPTRGLAELQLQFIGKNGNSVCVTHTVVICDNIDFDFILGRDITGSKLKIAETNEFLYLSELNERIHNLTNYLANHRQQICDVPIFNRSLNSFDVCTTQTIEIPPFSFYNVACSISDDTKPLPVKIGEGAVLFEVVAVNVSDLQTLRNCALAYTDPTELSIPLYNDTNDFYVLEKDTTIAQIEHFQNEIPIYEMQMKVLNGEVYKLNNIQPAFINNDEFMSEEEKEAAFMDFAEKGFYQPSMSYLIEEAPTITELQLKNVEPYPEHKFEDLFQLQHLSKVDRRTAARILRQHKPCFSTHDQDIGKVNCMEMDIQIDETKPRIQKYVPIPHAARPQVKQILDQMKEYNIIRECNEPSLFCSNLLVVPKKDKKLLRIILDGRLLNNATVRLPTNLVNSSEIKVFLTNKTHITTVDVSHAFYQIPLAEKAQPLTAFYSDAHGKRYCFQRAPQGLKNSPLQLKLLMDHLLGDMMDTVIHYVDDIMIATNGSFEDHMAAFDKVLERIEKSGLKINPKKVFLAQESIEFLGIVWKKGSLHIPDAKLSAFRQYPVPHTPKTVKSFVCAMSYYRQFIPRYAELSKPLMDLTSLHPKQFKWEKEHQTQFQLMIDTLIENCSLHLPQPDEPFFVQTDASDVCGAGRIFQKNEKGEEMLLACISRTFTRAERKYGAFKKEVLALLYTLRSMDFFLSHAKKLTILVDAKAIIFLRLCKDSSGILLRFSLEISRYDAEIHHVSGPDNFISDILSRHNSEIDGIVQDKKKVRYLSEQQAEKILNQLTIPNSRVFTKEEVAYMLEVESLIDPVPKKPKRSTAKAGKRVFPNMPQTLHDRKIKMPKESFRRPGVLLPTCSCSIAQSDNCAHPTMNYDELKHITQVIISGRMNVKQFIKLQSSDDNIKRISEMVPRSKLFKYVEGILYFGTKNPKPVLPDALLDALITTKHFTLFGLHNSATRIKRDILQQFHVTKKKLSEKLKRLKTNCMICQFNKTNNSSQEFRVSTFRKAPQTCWAVDIIPNMPLTKNGNRAIFLAIDMFTGFVTLAPLKSRNSDDLIQAFTSAILIPFKIPQIVRCDNETGMANSAEFKKFFDKQGTKFEPTSTASPWSNGAAERAVQTIKASLRKFTMQEHIEDCWDTHLHFFNGAHNNSTSVYGFAPNELHYGFKLPTPVDLLQFWPKATTQQEYMDIVVPLANKARDIANEKAIKENLRVLTYRNKNRSTKSFQVGEIVLHKQLQLATGANMGMKPKFTGPYVVTHLDKNNSSAIIENLANGRTMKAHFTNLQLFSYHPDFARLPNDFETTFLEQLPIKPIQSPSQESSSTEDTETQEFNLEFDQLISNDDSNDEILDSQLNFGFDSQQLCDACSHLQTNCRCQSTTSQQQCSDCSKPLSTCTCPSQSQVDEDDLFPPRPRRQRKRKIRFTNGTSIQITNDHDEHPDDCRCFSNESDQYGYRNGRDHDPEQVPRRSIHKLTDNYGPFHPPLFRPHKVCSDSGYIVNDYDALPQTISEKAVQGIVQYQFDPNKVDYKIIRRNDLPLGIVDDNVPTSVYHSTMNPLPSTSRTDTPARTDSSSRTENPARTDKNLRTDKRSLNTDSGVTVESSSESPAVSHNLRTRKPISYSEEAEHEPPTNDRDSNSRTDDSQSSLNSMSTSNLTLKQSLRLQFLKNLLKSNQKKGYLLTPMEMMEHDKLEQIRNPDLVPKHLSNLRFSQKDENRLIHLNNLSKVQQLNDSEQTERKDLNQILYKMAYKKAFDELEI